MKFTIHTPLEPNNKNLCCFITHKENRRINVWLCERPSKCTRMYKLSQQQQQQYASCSLIDQKVSVACECWNKNSSHKFALGLSDVALVPNVNNTTKTMTNDNDNSIFHGTNKQTNKQQQKAKAKHKYMPVQTVPQWRINA